MEDSSTKNIDYASVFYEGHLRNYLDNSSLSLVLNSHYSIANSKVLWLNDFFPLSSHRERTCNTCIEFPLPPCAWSFVQRTCEKTRPESLVSNVSCSGRGQTATAYELTNNDQVLSVCRFPPLQIVIAPPWGANWPSFTYNCCRA